MTFRNLFWSVLGASAATLVYGALVEANRLVVERRRLSLRGWPKKLDGFRIAVLADLHLRDKYSLDLAQRAVAAALAEAPDMVVLPGDLVGYWKEESIELLGRTLEPLRLMRGACVIVPGNHEYWGGTPEPLVTLCDEFGIQLLANEVWAHKGIQWAGVDSANAGHADPFSTMAAVKPKKGPVVAIWHEPDLVDWLPNGAALQISGHSHGGQFRLPNGWAPKHTDNGRIYVDGFFPEASTPLFVSRGIGTTGPPSRLFCPPTVDILELGSD